MDLKAEFLRRKNNRSRMLLAFKRWGELTTSDLLHYGPGMSSRLHELRKDGHVIVAQYESPGHFRYVYLGDKKDDDSKVSVVD